MSLLPLRSPPHMFPLLLAPCPYLQRSSLPKTRVLLQQQQQPPHPNGSVPFITFFPIQTHSAPNPPSPCDRRAALQHNCHIPTLRPSHPQDAPRQQPTACSSVPLPSLLLFRSRRRMPLVFFPDPSQQPAPRSPALCGASPSFLSLVVHIQAQGGGKSTAIVTDGAPFRPKAETVTHEPPTPSLPDHAKPE